MSRRVSDKKEVMDYAGHCAILWHIDQDVLQPKRAWDTPFPCYLRRVQCAVFAIETLEMLEGDLPSRA
jgi:hypothetical protein